MKSFIEKIVEKDEILNIVNEIKIIIREIRYNIDSIKDFKKDYPDKFIKSEEAVIKYIAENDPKILKTEIPDNKYLPKKSISI